MEDKKGSFDTVGSELLIYQTEDGQTKIDVKFEDETVWHTQAQLCELYQTSKSNISEQIKHIFEEGELEETSVVRKFRTTAADGEKYNTTNYNLVSHAQAIEKATEEYRKYHAQNLLPVEEEYLESIKKFKA